VTEPRLMTGAEAAAYLGITSATFAKWVANGRAPKPLPGTRRWDRKAIDLALDKVSGIPPARVSKEDQEQEAEQRWERDYAARSAAHERDPEYVRKKAVREAALAKRRGRRKQPD
jgi:excisionase family DNA binding protein